MHLQRVLTCMKIPFNMRPQIVSYRIDKCLNVATKTELGVLLNINGGNSFQEPGISTLQGYLCYIPQEISQPEYTPSNSIAPRITFPIACSLLRPERPGYPVALNNKSAVSRNKGVKKTEQLRLIYRSSS